MDFITRYFIGFDFTISLQLLLSFSDLISVPHCQYLLISMTAFPPTKGHVKGGKVILYTYMKSKCMCIVSF